MKKSVLSPMLVLVLLVSTFDIAYAITDDEPEGKGHLYVGLMVADNPLWRCNGTLISSTVFLTVGHCTEAPEAHAIIWFETDIQSNQEALGYPFGGSTSVDGTTYTHPQFNPAAFFVYDLGIVVLDTPVVMDVYGQLPALNQLDDLKTKSGKQDVTFTAIGYGLQASFPDAAAWKESALKVRMVAHPKLLQINVPGYGGDFSLLLSNNHSTGGTCFGDSGGPNFVGDSNVIGGVTSFGKNGNCAGTGGVYRIDRADDLAWLATFLD